LASTTSASPTDRSLGMTTTAVRQEYEVQLQPCPACRWNVICRWPSACGSKAGCARH
jgi:hypothetical protein